MFWYGVLTMYIITSIIVLIDHKNVSNLMQVLFCPYAVLFCILIRKFVR